MTYKERLDLLKEKAESLGMNLDYEPEVKGVFPVQDEEWLKARKEGIGGSEAGTILGINHYQTAQQLALEKLSVSVGREIDADTQYTLDFGHVLEKLMLDLYAARTGFKVWQGNNTQWRHPLYPFMYGDCDGYAMTDEGEKIGIECKTYNYEMKSAWKSGVFGKGGVVKNPEYVAQVAHYMAVENLTRFDLLAICGNNAKDLVVVTFYRDLDFEKNLIAKEEEFWNNLKAGIVPKENAIPDSSFDRIIEMIRPKELQKKTTVLSSKFESTLKELEEISNKRSALNKKLDTLKEQQNALLVDDLIEEMADFEKAELATADTIYTVSYKPVVKDGVDVDGLKIAYPDIYEKYKKETVTKPVFRLSSKVKTK